MDRIAVSGTVDAGSIPAWSANVHTPLPYLGPPRCACAEIVRQRGVLLSVVIKIVCVLTTKVTANLRLCCRRSCYQAEYQLFKQHLCGLVVGLDVSTASILLIYNPRSYSV